MSEFILDDLNDPHTSAPTSIEEHLSSPSFSASSTSYISSNELITNFKKETSNPPSEASYSQISSINTCGPASVTPLSSTLLSPSSSLPTYSSSIIAPLSLHQSTTNHSKQNNKTNISTDQPKAVIPTYSKTLNTDSILTIL